MTTLFLDLETFSAVPITNGTHAYAAGAEIMLFAYAIDDGPDALQMLWMAATTMGASTSGFQSVGRHGSGDEYGRESRRMF